MMRANMKYRILDCTVDGIDDDVTGEAGVPVETVTIGSPSVSVFHLQILAAHAGQMSVDISARGHFPPAS